MYPSFGERAAKIFIIVMAIIAKEGLMGIARPILLLVWHSLYKIIYDWRVQITNLSLMSYQKKDWRDPDCQSVFWYGYDKDINRCAFCSTHLMSPLAPDRFAKYLCTWSLNINKRRKNLALLGNEKHTNHIQGLFTCGLGIPFLILKICGHE